MRPLRGCWGLGEKGWLWALPHLPLEKFQFICFVFWASRWAVLFWRGASIAKDGHTLGNFPSCPILSFQKWKRKANESELFQVRDERVAKAGLLPVSAHTRPTLPRTQSLRNTSPVPAAHCSCGSQQHHPQAYSTGLQAQGWWWFIFFLLLFYAF